MKLIRRYEKSVIVRDNGNHTQTQAFLNSPAQFDRKCNFNFQKTNEDK